MTRFELSEGTSNKFWEIRLEGKSLTTTFGKIGTAGQSRTRQCASESDAERERDKLIAEKTGKGYQLVGAKKPSSGSRTPAKAKPASRGTRFEDLVRYGIEMIDAQLAKQRLAAGPITAVAIGYDQSRFFYRVTQEESGDIEKLFKTPSLTIPPMTPEWIEDHADKKEAAEAWSRAWYDGQLKLGVLAAGLVALALHLRHLQPSERFARGVLFSIHEDYETLVDGTAPTSVDPFQEFEDGLPVAELFEHPQTLQWARAAGKLRPALTLKGMKTLDAKFPLAEMIGNVS